jgi:uncharacterized protein
MPKPISHFWLFLIAFFAAWSLRATWFYSHVDLVVPDGPWRLVISKGLKFALWVLPAAVYVLWHDRQNPLVVMKAGTRLDRDGVLVGVGACAVYCAGILLFARFIFHQTLAPLLQSSPASVFVALTGIFLTPVFEEWLFRGFVLTRLGENMPFWPANLLQALLFTLIHWPNWLWVGGFHWSLLTTSASILLLGLFFGWLTRRTNSIWPAVVMHFLNNFLAVFLG